MIQEKPSKTCAYLTMADPGDYVMDYPLSYAAMAGCGWHATAVDWRDAGIDWDAFDAVYVCTPWDYPDHVDEFLRVLAAIDASSAVLVNPLPLIRWNLSKTYLRELAERGADVVPSLWFDSFDGAGLDAAFGTLQSDKLVIKPAVGANAKDTFVLEAPLPAGLSIQLATTFDGRAYFLQPFIDSVISEGEYSLFYFSGDYSHAILKTPKPGDFRSQEEHGAEIRSVDAGEDLRRAGRKILALLQPTPVYMRADFVRAADDRFLLMELELIEPSLYFRMDADSASRFAVAFDRYYRSRERQ